jgi:hypothetical protein
MKSERRRRLYRQFSERDPTQQLIDVASRSAPKRRGVSGIRAQEGVFGGEFSLNV